MSYPDTLSRLEGQVRQLEDSRMQEARERDRLRSEVNQLRAALTQFVAACDTAPPTSVMVEIGMARNAAVAALART
jgi:hypothetical protein